MAIKSSFVSLWDICDFTKSDKDRTNVTHLRNVLKESQAYLKEQFLNKADIEYLVHQRAHFVDQALQVLWEHHLPKVQHVSLLAVGGYGRGELHPFSDIDLLILLDDAISSSPPNNLTTFLTQLWDIGLEIGHSVRTLSECEQQATEDITVATNLLETRLLSGDESLFQHLTTLTSEHKSWDTKLFYQAKRHEQEQRHQKYNDTANNLEPNIKESPGGLRDIQIINWVALQHFDEKDLKGLNYKQFISNSEYVKLYSSKRFLWKIRFGLHLLAKRKQEKLMINYQRDLAELLGYSDSDSRLAVEHFMKDYYRCARKVGQMNDLLLQLFEENIILADEPRQITPINRRFQIHNGYLETINAGIFAYYPMAMLELFLVLQQHPEIKGVRADTIRQLHAHIHLIDDRFRNDIKHKALFMEIIRQPKGITHEFRRMNAYGVLGAYLPEFGQIVGQMQHDLFHAYTVDEHTLFLVRNLRRFSCTEFEHEFPLCSHVFKKLPKTEILYIAGLYHDIAKGRGGDHSVLGVVDAEAFCQRHSLSQFDTEIVKFLVRHHLLMSSTSQKLDVQDPDVVKHFAANVQTIDRLNYLYLITVADIRATNNELWNGWRDSLLKQLYHNTKQWLVESEKLAQNTHEKAIKIRQQALEALTTDSWSETEITELWQNFELSHFAQYTIETIVWQTQSILSHPRHETIIAERALTDHTLEIFIYTTDKSGLFAAMTSCFERLDLDILDAKIGTTSDGKSLNSYVVNGNLNHKAEIIKSLTDYIDNIGKTKFTSYSGVTPRTMKLFETKPSVSFYNNESQQYTVLELGTHDRPGLLSSVARVFLESNIQLANAKLTTLGDQVEDVFFIKTDTNVPLSTQEQDELREVLIKQLTY